MRLSPSKVVSNLRVGSASVLPELSEANPHMSISAFSFAVAHEMTSAYLKQPLETCLPKELQNASKTLEKN